MKGLLVLLYVAGFTAAAPFDDELVITMLSGEIEDNRDELSPSQVALFSCTVLSSISENADVDIIRTFIIENFQDEWKTKLLNALDIGIPTLRSLLIRQCSHGFISKAWKKIKKTFSRVGNDLKKKFSTLGKWLEHVAKSRWENLKAEADQLKEMVISIISNKDNLTVTAAKEAMAFLTPHKETIGIDLWNKLVSILIVIISG